MKLFDCLSFQSTVGGDSWSVYRRYRKFRELHKSMKKVYFEVITKAAVKSSTAALLKPVCFLPIPPVQIGKVSVFEPT